MIIEVIAETLFPNKRSQSKLMKKDYKVKLTLLPFIRPFDQVNLEK